MALLFHSVYNPLICYGEMLDLEMSPFDHDAGCTFLLLEKNDPKNIRKKLKLQLFKNR